jgi:hypothetical protein
MEVGVVAEPDFDPDTLDQIDHMIKLVNLTAAVQEYRSQGFTDLWVMDPMTGRSKRIWILNLPN